MNQQEQATKRAAIFQDTINGTNDPTPWPVTMWATSGDTIWTAGTARTAGEDSVGMIYAPGETIAHRNTIAGDTTRATVIDGQDLTGWATDMFMSGKNQSQKNEGRAVNLRFRPGTPVELFTGRGAERRTVQVDPQTLVQAIIDAQKRSRDAEETLDTASVELASKTVEESWPQISRMQGRFTEYRRAGTYKPAVALKWARRLVDRTAGGDEGRWTNRQRRQAARLLIQELAGAQEPMQDRGKTPTRPTIEQDAEATDTPRKTEPTKETEQGRDHDEAGSPAADPGAKAEPPETTRRDDPERRHTDLKSTLDRFHTKLRENLDGLNTATPAPGIDRNHGQRKTL